MDPSPAQDARILGIDPGLQVTGYAVIERGKGGPCVCEAGIIRGNADGAAGTDMARRLVHLYDGIVEVLREYKPSAVAVEQLFAHYDHPRTAILMGHARGVLLLATGQCGLTVHSYSATGIKKTITGHGRATKDQMQRAMQRELGLDRLPEPPDVADALAAALCHCYTMKLHA
jgi:crossover junction endodeoxyribonuclease RuvC